MSKFSKSLKSRMTYFLDAESTKLDDSKVLEGLSRLLKNQHSDKIDSKILIGLVNEEEEGAEDMVNFLKLRNKNPPPSSV